MDPKLDRRVPQSFRHVRLFAADEVLPPTPASVEVALRPPVSRNGIQYHRVYDQGNEGACVGFGESITMSILNRKYFDAWWLYREAQARDEWSDTPPESGTSLSAGFDVLRELGHRYIRAGVAGPPLLQHGIVTVNRWLSQFADEGRAALSIKSPCVDGIAWFQRFYAASLIERKIKLPGGRYKSEWWIPEPENWGRLLGYHCITRAGASDRRQAFEWLNSWGESYPWPVYISYRAHEKLMQVQGESAIVTDR